MSIADPATCQHPAANRRYWDSQHRDAHGRILAARRQITCQLCDTITEDSTKTWDETVTTTERFGDPADVARERHPPTTIRG